MVERCGRRWLMIICALGQAFTMACLTGLLSHAALQYDLKQVDAGLCELNLGVEYCRLVPGIAKNMGYAIGGTVLLYVFLLTPALCSIRSLQWAGSA